MTAQLDTIPFHNTNIHTIQLDGKPYVLLKPAFQAIGIDADSQIRKVQKQSWSCTVRTAVQLDSQVRDMIAADLRTFLMALATIPSSRVASAVRPLLEAFQSEAADVIEAYFNRGMASINPRVAPDQVPAVLDQAVADYQAAQEKRIVDASVCQAQLSMLRMAQDLLDEKWIATKAQVIVARGLGEAPSIKEVELPLYVEDFMHSKGVSRSKVSRFSGAFGKKVIQQAGLEGTPVPGKRTQETPDGSLREITAWTKEHLPIFERAWRASYAGDARLIG